MPEEPGKSAYSLIARMHVQSVLGGFGWQLSTFVLFHFGVAEIWYLRHRAPQRPLRNFGKPSRRFRVQELLVAGIRRVGAVVPLLSGGSVVAAPAEDVADPGHFDFLLSGTAPCAASKRFF